jgi:hypothetical protein
MSSPFSKSFQNRILISNLRDSPPIIHNDISLIFRYDKGYSEALVNFNHIRVPEIPDLQILTSHGGFIPWEFEETRYYVTGASMMRFSLETEYEHFAHPILAYYELLYG